MTRRLNTKREMASFIQARVPASLDEGLSQYAEERDLSFSEAIRQLLEIGLVAADAARDLPPDVDAYRFVAVPADDASPDDPSMFPGDDEQA